MKTELRKLLGSLLLLTVAACGGGGSGDTGPAPTPPVTAPPTTPPVTTPPTTPPVTAPPPVTPPAPSPTGMTPAEAASLLTRATFGTTQADLDAAAGKSAAAWVDEQLARPATAHLPVCRSLPGSSGGIDRESRAYAWWQVTLIAPDQLRQRVAFALSQIMVVSDQASIFGNTGGEEGLCAYYDMLLRNAFGNYRTLLEDVTLSPQMGVYLSLLNSRKPDPATGRRADENFARESMQLFSIGLKQLNADGSAKLDSAGAPLPAYTQPDIENLARALTGWTWAKTNDWLVPMIASESVHDTGAKTLVGGVSVPAGGTAKQDLAIALDTLFKHPNTAPFISRALIQRLVTSNPTVAYVKRVAAVFANDGKGVRGNLGAVVRAILLDEEARRGKAASAFFGKPREPLLRQTHLWRLLKAQPALSSGRYMYTVPGALAELGQMALSANSVFNFFSPGYAPAGEIRDAGIVAPEFQLSTEPGVALSSNRLYLSIYYDYVGRSGVNPNAIRSDLSALMPLAADSGALLDRLNLLLMSGQMDASLLSELRTYLDAIPVDADGGLARLQEALYLMFASPQYQIQR